MLDRDGVRGVGELIDIIFDHLFVEVSYARFERVWKYNG